MMKQNIIRNIVDLGCHFLSIEGKAFLCLPYQLHDVKHERGMIITIKMEVCIYNMQNTYWF